MYMFLATCFINSYPFAFPVLLSKQHHSEGIGICSAPLAAQENPPHEDAGFNPELSVAGEGDTTS